MSRGPLIIFADDLTGAAEIAAIAHQAGLRAIVHLHASAPLDDSDADVIVLNTNTRLASPTQAARRVRSLIGQLRKRPHARFFKKTDSVLRGPVLAELEACLAGLGRRRALLVPCNPSLDRVIQNGRYFVAGQPLEQTPFARDPHHPCATSEVIALLGAKKDSGVRCLTASAAFPKTGVIVGEATSLDEIDAWAASVDSRTLPAGGADFFRAWLKTVSGSHRPVLQDDSLPPSGVALLLSGTTAPLRPDSPLDARAVRFRGGQPPSVSALSRKLRQDKFAAVASSKSRSRDPKAPVVISRRFAQLAVQLRRAGVFRHLLIAGGATASTVLGALRWPKLEVVRVWAPGVVTLQPVADPDFFVTLKPGSYAWPAELSHHLLTASRNP